MLSIIILALIALSAPAAAVKCRTDQPRCPNENACTTTTGNGAVFELKCATDYNGDIIQSTQVHLAILRTYGFYTNRMN
jgi:hypothetical protein